MFQVHCCAVVRVFCFLSSSLWSCKGVLSVSNILQYSCYGVLSVLNAL